MRRLVWMMVLLAAGGPVMARADGRSMNCGSNDGPLMVHDYERGAGDVVLPARLQVERPFAADGRMEVQVCDADLRVRTVKDAREIRLTVEVAQGVAASAMDFVHTLRIGPEKGVIRLRFPKNAKAVVTLSLPMGKGSVNEISLGRGDLDFNAVGSAGQREINLGMGKMLLHVDGDRSYSKMEVNVGMGTMHDERPGGENRHFVVSKEHDGKGDGSVEVNVGMGTLDIRND